MQELTHSELKDKIYGCFLGKNIGGTLGTPFEGRTQIFDLDFYRPVPDGNPLPNDDLDLQLLWLTIAELYGPENITSRLLGEYWISAITGPWNEYAHCRWNCMEGFYPPLSGSCDNEHYKYSNGAWIRSEIWACLTAGNPDRAIEYAWLDSSADHCGEGIYAEMFTAALESAAFYGNDINELIKIALAKIPATCRVRRSIEMVIVGHDCGKSWQVVREEIVKLNEDMGWFQAPSNVAFAIIGLLYGDDDFGKTICTAVNCGDDTDCTGATAGAVWGIIHGASNIPEKWKKPIGDNICSCAISHFAIPIEAPQSVSELVERVINLREVGKLKFPEYYKVSDNFYDTTVAEQVWKRSTTEMHFNISFADLAIDYPDGPWIEEGKSCRLKFTIDDVIPASGIVRFRWILPENWRAEQLEMLLAVRQYCTSSMECKIYAPEEIPDAMSYLTLQITYTDHHAPFLVSVPFRKRGSVNFPDVAKSWSVSEIARKMNLIRNQAKEIRKKL